MRRLSERTSREAHENIETLRMLGQAYEKWLQQFADITTQVDAENFASLDRFFERMSSHLAHGL